MGVGPSKVMPVDDTFMASRSIYASVPNSTRPCVEIPIQVDALGMSEVNLQPISISGPTATEPNPTLTQEPSTTTEHGSCPVTQLKTTSSKCNLNSRPLHPREPPKDEEVIKIKFRETLWSRCKREVEYVPDDGDYNDDPFIVSIDTPTENLTIPRFRVWQIFPGGNEFYCNGRCMMSKETWVFYLSFAVLHIIFGIFFAFVAPCLVLRVSILLAIAGGFLYFVCVALMLYSTCSDPGILPRGTKSEIAYNQAINNAEQDGGEGQRRYIRELVNEMSVVRRWCPTCKFYKPPRSTHCRTCNNCVERFDHHCPFLGNCVGQRNYPTFFMFIIMITLSAIYVSVCCTVYVYLKYEDFKETRAAFENSIPACIAGFSSFIIFCTMVPLVFMHFRLIASEITTNEDYKHYAMKENPYHRGSKCKNCLYILCSARIPSLIRRRDYVTRRYFNSLNYAKSVEDALIKRFGRGDKPDHDDSADPSPSFNCDSLSIDNTHTGPNHQQGIQSTISENNNGPTVQSSSSGNGNGSVPNGNTDEVSLPLTTSAEYINFNYDSLKAHGDFISRKNGQLMDIRSDALTTHSEERGDMSSSPLKDKYPVANSNQRQSDMPSSSKEEGCSPVFRLTRSSATPMEYLTPTVIFKTRYGGTSEWNSVSHTILQTGQPTTRNEI